MFVCVPVCVRVCVCVFKSSNNSSNLLTLNNSMPNCSWCVEATEREQYIKKSDISLNHSYQKTYIR